MALKNNDLKAIVEAEVQGSGVDNKQVGYERAANRISELIDTKKLSVSDFSLREMYRSLVDPNFELAHASAKSISEAIQSSAFPNITSKVMHSTVMPAYFFEIGNIPNLVTESDAYHAGSNDVPGFTAADTPKMRREGFGYKETGMSEKYATIDCVDIGQIISLTREAIFNDRTGQLVTRAKEIGKYLAQARERMIIETIEVATRTDLEETTSRAFVMMGTAISASNFYNSDHSAVAGLDGQVNDTVDVTDDDTLSSAGLDAVANLFPAMLDEKGSRISVKPKQLLVPTRYRRKAWQLTVSAGEYDTANNAENYFKGLYETYTSPYLSTAYYYYLGDFPKQLMWLWVWRPETEVQGAGTDLAFERQIVLRMRTSMNGGCGHVDYRNIVRGGTT